MSDDHAKVERDGLIRLGEIGCCGEDGILFKGDMVFSGYDHGKIYKRRIRDKYWSVGERKI